ncbi:LysM peptidoglycan-binding domain-containing protein [Streptomyces cahuitamycinicus]|uniref:LysM peptidoglycan-binding domain-containing protein n=1 Tax=Streptomyces cahuitamycinicus TaxID=2070367 RepID=UPI0015E0F09C|nr:LysM peptidoglycan-binding domain-containing protein [Streptomyces cahuitamycinicus]
MAAGSMVLSSGYSAIAQTPTPTPSDTHTTEPPSPQPPSVEPPPAPEDTHTTEPVEPVEPVAPEDNPTTEPAPQDTAPAQACTHTVVSGDTLWDIAARNLGDPERWTEVYESNQAVIEAAAREHPAPPVLGTSDHGHWIFPGTTLTIPGASCAPTTTTPTTPTTETTPTSGGVSDEQACKAVGGIPAETQSGEFYCGRFNTLAAPAPPLTQAELNEILLAENTVGCVKDIAGLLSGLTALDRVADTVLFVDGVATTAEDAMRAGGVRQIVAQFKNPASGEDQTLVWDIITLAPGGGCFKLGYDRVVGTQG